MTSASSESTARIFKDSIVTGSFPQVNHRPTIFETDDFLEGLNYPMNEGEWRLRETQDAKGKISLRLKWTETRIQGIDVRIKYSLTFQVHDTRMGARQEVMETEHECIDLKNEGEFAWSINRPNFTTPGYGGVASVASALSLSFSLKVRNCDEEISGAAKNYASTLNIFGRGKKMWLT